MADQQIKRNATRQLADARRILTRSTSFEKLARARLSTGDSSSPQSTSMASTPDRFEERAPLRSSRLDILSSVTDTHGFMSNKAALYSKFHPDPSTNLAEPQARKWTNYALLISLYFLQGIPIGLTFGSIPYLLKSIDAGKLSYSELGLFSLAGYPYSLKLLWSPIVDSFYSSRFGRRKSWIVPIQVLIGMGFIWLGMVFDQYVNPAEIKILPLTLLFVSLVFLCATQDIAVDGWALTLLDKRHIHYASTCQTIGLNGGYFMSFTVFLALNSSEFCNIYLRQTPSATGILELAPFLKFWGFAYLVATLLVALYKREPSGDSGRAVGNVVYAYKVIYRILSLRNIQLLAGVLLLSKIGFIAHDTIAPLKLLEKGFPKEDLALTVLADFPMQIVFGFLAAKWSSGGRPLRPWLLACYCKFIMALVGMIILNHYPAGPMTRSYFAAIFISTVLSSFASTVKFVSLGAFFASISDPVIGGTYITLLNTCENLAGTWPRLFALSAVDWFTERRCTMSSSDLSKLAGSLDSSTLECIGNVGQAACTKLGGSCTIIYDGYDAVNITCLLSGLILFVFGIHQCIRKLEQIPGRRWKVSDHSVYERL